MPALTAPLTRPRLPSISLALGCLIGLLLSLSALADPVPRIRQAINPSQRVVLAGHVHPALREAEDLGEIGAEAPPSQITLLLRESDSQAAELDALLRAQQKPGNPQYRQWLSPSEFGRRFGVADADLKRLRAWLRSQGLEVTEVPAGQRSLVIQGPLPALGLAFGTRFHRYRWRGDMHVAAHAEPSIPAALAPVVRGFAALHDFDLRPLSLRSAVRPHFTDGAGTHFLAPADYAVLYNLQPLDAAGLTGRGRSIAVLGKSAVVTSDISTFRSSFALPASAITVLSNGTTPGIVSGDELESDLDLEWSGATAPEAQIIFVTSLRSGMNDGILQSAQYAVSRDVADIISVSYGGCENALQPAQGAASFNQIWQQAAAQGISVLVSSGDSGAAGCAPSTASSGAGALGVNLLCTSPYSTCVGGTQFDADVANPTAFWSAANVPGTQASALAYIPEVVWNQSGSNLASSGGGASLYFDKPVWQYATNVPADGRRDVPDIALSASSAHDPYLVQTSDTNGQGSQLGGVGGTSASTPALAGMIARVAQQTGGRLGCLNPTLYALSELQVAGGATVFHRITSGNNSVPGLQGFTASPTSPAYNQATGLGSPDATMLLQHWTDATALLPTPGVSALTPTRVVVPPTASSGSVQLTLTSGTQAWSVSGAPAWLSFSPASGTGSQPLSFTVAANAGNASRSATNVQIAGLNFLLIQAAADGAALVTPSPVSLSFAASQVGRPDSPQRIQFSNSGGSNLAVGTAALTGNAAADFSVTGGSCLQTIQLAPGASCTLSVSFDPTLAGARQASLNLAGANIALDGTGLSPVQATADGDVPTLPQWAALLLGGLLITLAGGRSSGHRS